MVEYWDRNPAWDGRLWWACKSRLTGIHQLLVRCATHCATPPLVTCNETWYRTIELILSFMWQLKCISPYCRNAAIPNPNKVHVGPFIIWLLSLIFFSCYQHYVHWWVKTRQSITREPKCRHMVNTFSTYIVFQYSCLSLLFIFMSGYVLGGNKSFS